MKPFQLILAGIAVSAFSTPVQAQMMGSNAASIPAGITNATITTTKRTLSLEGAKIVLAAAVAEAKRTGSGGAIAIVDEGGNAIALERLDGTFPAGANISFGKARTAALFQRPTRFFEDVIKNGRTAMVALNDFTPLMGGVPIMVDGQIVGAIGVSGATNAQRDDEIATAGAAVLNGGTIMTRTNATPTVTFYDRNQVADSFTAGRVLFDGVASGRNYMIHTSRRDKPGMAEIHLKDTDLFYITEGTGTLVTGGTLMDGKTTASDEIRGAAIQGGERHRLTRGDVVIVPAGTPHWFQDINGALTYYTVKVR